MPWTANQLSVPIDPVGTHELQQRHGRIDVARIAGPFGGGVIHVGHAGAIHAGAFDLALREQDLSRLEVGVGGQDRFGDSLG